MRARTFSIPTRCGAVVVTDVGGSGFPLLLIHGSSYSARVFEKQFDSELARHWRLIAVDLPGHGRSEDAADPQSGYTVSGLADCLAEVLRRCRLSRVVVYGWSLGGHVAIELLARNAAIAGLVCGGAPPVQGGFLGMLKGFSPSFDLLLASKQTFTPRDAERFERLCFGRRSDGRFRDDILRSDGRMRAIFTQSMMRGDGTDQRRAIETAEVPVAFVNGADEPFVRLGYFDGLSVPMLHGGEPQLIEGAGHAPFWEQPEAFNAFVDRFMLSVMENEVRRKKRRVARA
ncbi:alpha/beta hydrolase [Rhizobium sp. TRM95111]|uniref:alpha/beta fold hydrolase n=1 Tax=Rhizobium alarense TaxID=2846851 RepID=UPI001F20EB9D|nr:alpha/beta hydrolase [Rhizobium alarense]MCF3639413.1 alpha/beta hydrolase [Rhizobium alarense]